jgi:uncharacterized membrane protein YbaN (DUF454 family)
MAQGRFSKLAQPFRRALGVSLLVVGVAGLILPLLPGWPMLFVGGRILGRQDPLMRRLVLSGHRCVRWLRQSRVNVLKQAGAKLTPHWQRALQLLVGQ